MKQFLGFLAIVALIFSVQELQSQSLRQKVMQRLNKKVEIKDKEDSVTVVEIEDASSSFYTNEEDEKNHIRNTLYDIVEVAFNGS